MQAREFLVLHTRGVASVKARGCAHALQKCFVPGGYREVIAVIDAAYVERGENSRPSGWAPFTAFIVQPVPRKS